MHNVQGLKIKVGQLVQLLGDISTEYEASEKLIHDCFLLRLENKDLNQKLKDAITVLRLQERETTSPKQKVIIQKTLENILFKS